MSDQAPIYPRWRIEAFKRWLAPNAFRIPEAEARAVEGDGADARIIRQLQQRNNTAGIVYLPELPNVVMPRV